jgi:endonuclease/exonuclease/phosphatase family metal-dependent hydrolase
VRRPAHSRGLPLPLILALACGPQSIMSGTSATTGAPERVRVAVFNVKELSTEKLEMVDADGRGQHAQLLAAAEIVRRVAPDILVLQEIDHDYRSPEELELNARRFLRSYLATAHGEAAEGSGFPHLFAAPCNTGIPSGHDLDNDGRVAGPGEEGERGYGEDCFGFGTYPGQYSMALLSRFPIDVAGVRSFRELLWRDLPGHHMPPEFYTAAEIDRLRLSSKSHWDVPVRIGERVLHLWISHPTPPGFDGAEDRNGRRNFDEIALWVAYLENDPALYDDQGGRGGFALDEPFLIAGDLNSDPRSDSAFYDGRQSIDLLLAHPRIQDPAELCVSEGALAAAADGTAAHPERSTAVFRGGMRIDYLLPSTGLRVLDGGVYWPAAASDPEGHRLAEQASDHRLVWIDLDGSSL